jgi:apolipoprotein N-acyltransferase
MEPQGLTDYRYDKRYLVPFVERVPVVPPDWLGGLRYFGGYGVGRGWPLVETGGAAYGVLICYESSYPEGSRSFRLAGADVLLNITNDAWYGREPLYARTTALWQHPAHMVMRAIENRMGVARAANTGISLYVDPVGRVYNATDLFEADVRTDVVHTTDVVTLYTRFGDVTGNGAAVAALLIVLVSVGRSRREGRQRG